MKFIGVVDSRKEISASEAIILNISNDGGVFVPSSFPILDEKILSELVGMSCAEREAKILSLFIDELSYGELLDCVEKACAKFDEYCPIVKAEDGLYMLEMWHGPSYSRKDVGATLYPYVLQALCGKNSKPSKLLAAFAVGEDLSFVKSFQDVQDAKAIAFYAANGLADSRRKLLLADNGKGIRPIAVDAGIADIRAELKQVFDDEETRSQMQDCTVCRQNDMNVLNVLGALACFVSAYCDLVESEEIEIGEKINFAVSDVNDCLALYYAYKTGLPINKIVLATNANNALVDLINGGKFDLNRDSYRTISPALDVLGNDSLERFVFELVGRDSDAVAKAFAELKEKGKFDLNTRADEVFEAGWADEEETKETVFTFFDLDDYIMDTHTAVAASVYSDYCCDTEDETPTVILSAYSPYLYGIQTLGALGSKERDENRAINKLQNATALECPWELLSEQVPDDAEKITVKRMKDVILQTAKEML